MSINPSPVETALFSEDEARLRTELYLHQRIEYQDEYYKRRIAEFTFNSDMMLWFSALLMGVSTIISSYSVVTDRPAFAFVTALLPAFATAISAFRALYQWQRQATIYEDCWLSLQQARLSMPDTDFLKAGDYGRFFPELVLRSETVLRHEASQWGQMEQVPTTPVFKTQETPAVKPKSAAAARRRRT